MNSHYIVEGSRGGVTTARGGSGSARGGLGLANNGRVRSLDVLVLLFESGGQESRSGELAGNVLVLGEDGDLPVVAVRLASFLLNGT